MFLIIEIKENFKLKMNRLNVYFDILKIRLKEIGDDKKISEILDSL